MKIDVKAQQSFSRRCSDWAEIYFACAIADGRGGNQVRRTGDESDSSLKGGRIESQTCA